MYHPHPLQQLNSTHLELTIKFKYGKVEQIGSRRVGLGCTTKQTFGHILTNLLPQTCYWVLLDVIVKHIVRVVNIAFHVPRYAANAKESGV